MKSLTVIYSIIGIVLIGLLIWFIYSQVNKSKASGQATMSAVPVTSITATNPVKRNVSTVVGTSDVINPELV